MAPGAIYGLSATLRRTASAVAAQAVAQMTVPLALCEIITLPEIGQRVILRFGALGTQRLSLEEADVLEPQLRDLVGSDYWAVLVGAHLEGALGDPAEILAAIDAALPASLLTFEQTSQARSVAGDAETVRQDLNLSTEHWVWEIEMPVAEAVLPVVRVVDRSEPGPGTFSAHPTAEVRTLGGMQCEVVYLRYNPSFRGVVKAYAAAEQLRMALSSYIVRFGQGKALDEYTGADA